MRFNEFKGQVAQLSSEETLWPRHEFSYSPLRRLNSMGELGTALVTSAVILIGVVVLLVIVSRIAVNRGEVAMREDAKQAGKTH